MQNTLNWSTLNRVTTHSYNDEICSLYDQYSIDFDILDYRLVSN